MPTPLARKLRRLGAPGYYVFSLYDHQGNIHEREHRDHPVICIGSDGSAYQVDSGRHSPPGWEKISWTTAPSKKHLANQEAARTIVIDANSQKIDCL